METKEAPTFYPSFEEFKNFREYVSSIRPFCSCGLAKIVPPKEWSESKGMERVRKRYKTVSKIVVESPIRQIVNGRRGAFDIINEERPKISIKEFEKAAEKQEREAERYLSKCEGEQDVRRVFWKHIAFSPPLYAADSKGTLFEEDVEHWNLNHLDSLLSLIQEPVPGMNVAYLYFGMWKAMFAMHTEDLDLYSINFLHFGKDKLWYAVPPAHADRLETLANSFFPVQHKECDQFLRHKMYLLSPTVLQQSNIPFCTATQRAGEFIITFPRSYHFGFNRGFNCAESVNFALDDWIEFGKKAKVCRCDEDSVRIDMNSFLTLYKNSLKNEDQEEEEDMQVQPKHPKSPSPILQEDSAEFRVDCLCGAKKTFASAKQFEEYNSQGHLFQCDGCYAFGHDHCYERYAHLKSFPENMWCHKCSPVKAGPKRKAAASKKKGEKKTKTRKSL